VNTVAIAGRKLVPAGTKLYSVRKDRGEVTVEYRGTFSHTSSATEHMMDREQAWSYAQHLSDTQLEYARRSNPNATAWPIYYHGAGGVRKMIRNRNGEVTR